MKHDWTFSEIDAIYGAPFVDLVFRAQLAHREHHAPNEVQGSVLLNIKSGGCPEDCAYCPQSAHYKTGVARTELVSVDEALTAARAARAQGATRFCMGAAWRDVPRGPQFDRVLEMVRGVRALGMEACCTLGMLEQDQAEALAGAGLTAYNHNLDTSREFYGQIITTRTYDDRLATLSRVRAAGITVCCGGIIGMGESRDARLRLLQQLAALDPHPESVPINMLVAVEGTPLAARPPEDPIDLVRLIATARILMPRSYVRLSAGRLSLSDEAQALCFLAGANSVFLGDRLLTTPNPTADVDRSLFERLGIRLQASHEGHKDDPSSWPLWRRVAERMRSLEESGLLRTLRSPLGIDLSSNDYLGLANHPRIKERMMAAVAREGVGSTGSRLLRGERDSFAAVEARFARFKGTERSLYFSSGYLANLAVMTTFAEAGDVIISDERNHASLIDGIRLSPARREVVAHNDVAAVRRALEAGRAGRAGDDGEHFVVVESLFSMDGDEAPLAEYAEICEATGAHLIVDEAHAVGVYGERGSGLIEEQGVGDRVFLSVNTAGKALGVSGAFVAGPAWAIEYLIQRARPFVFSTAPPPALASALDASLDIVEQEPQRRAALRELSANLRVRLLTAGLPVGPGTSHIVPVLIGDNAAAVAVADAMQADGFDVRAIRPPSVPAGTARLRISVNVNLTGDVIERFVTSLAGRVSRPAPTLQRCSAGSS